MSTDYVTSKKIPAADLLDGRLETSGVREHISKNTTGSSKCLTDGRHFLWVYFNNEGFVSGLTRYGGNVPSKILGVIATTFETEIFSEYEPQYWGFETEEAWSAAMDKMSREHENAFYADLMKFISGEPNDIRPGTIGEIQAKIAKRVSEANPRLLLPEERKNFMDAIEAIHDRDHGVKVTLSEPDLAYIQLVSTHEDDMGGA